MRYLTKITISIAAFVVLACPLQAGIASWYGKEHHGKKTASGERFNMYELTAASWNYKFGTRVRVTNVATGESVVVRINDRGPNKRLKREIDLSFAAFRRIADPDLGLVQVKVEALQFTHAQRPRTIIPGGSGFPVQRSRPSGPPRSLHIQRGVPFQ